MSNSQDIITIEVRNWEKYQHHNGKRTYDWLKLSCGIIDDPEILALSASEFRVFITILCLCARRRSKIIQTSYKDLARFSRVRAEFSRDGATKLAEYRIVTLHLGTTEYNRVEENRKETTIAQKPFAQPKVARPIFDFNLVYQNYPRKVGKSAGMAKLKKSITEEVIFTNFKKAVDNYVRYCRVHKTEEKFIKHWSTFVNGWEDWVEPDQSIYQNGKGLTALEEMMLQAKAEQENAAI